MLIFADHKKQVLITQIRYKNSFLCIGLDVELDKTPQYKFKQLIQFLSLTSKLLMLLIIWHLPINQH